MKIRKLYKLIEKYFDKKVSMGGYNEQKNSVFGCLYNTIFIECTLNYEKNEFDVIVYYTQNDYFINKFLGETCKTIIDEDLIIDKLKVIDNYCRIRLTDKFLKVFDEACEKTNQDLLKTYLHK